MKGFTYNGETYPFDVYDVEQAARFERALERVTAATKSVPLDGKLSERMLWMLNVYKQFLDDMFGDGAADKMLDGCSNVRAVEAVCYDVIDMVTAQQREYEADTRVRRLKLSKRSKG